MKKKNTYAFFVAVAVLALLTVSFVPHHHHDGFMCMEDGHIAVDNGLCDPHGGHGTSGVCGFHGTCGPHDGCEESGEGHSEDRSNCIEDEVFLTYRSENYQIGALPSPVQLSIAAVITGIADCCAADEASDDFHDMPPCLYRSANIEGTFSLRAPPFLG